MVCSIFLPDIKIGVSLQISRIAAILLSSLILTAPCRADILYEAGRTTTIETFTSSGAMSPFINNGSAERYALAFDVAGNLYAADQSDNQIEKITPGGRVSVFASVTYTDGLAFDSAGNLYAADYADSEIIKITPSGVKSVFATGASGLDDPWGIAFDSTGNLFVANYGNSTIEKFTPGGVGSIIAYGQYSAVTPGATYIADLGNPTGIAFDGDGNLYLSNSDPFNRAIEKITPGGVASDFITTGLTGPMSLAFDSTGNLYIANNGSGSIEEVTPGMVTSTFASGLSSVTSLAFTNDAGQPLALPVPEPETWAQLAIGLPMALLLCRARRRRA